MTEVAMPRPFRYRGSPMERRVGWIAGVTGAVMLALSYAPLVCLSLMSISPEPLSGMPGTPTLLWYHQLFADLRWVTPLLTSIFVGCAVGIICAVMALIVARAVPHMRYRGGAMTAFLLPLFIPGVLMGVGLFISYRVVLGLPTGVWSTILGHFAWAFPFSLLGLLISTTRFDSRLSEAAGDLGATPLRSFLDIELPLIRPGLVAAGLFGFLLSFNELSRSILLRGTTTTLPLYEWAQASAHTSNVPLVFSLSTLVLIVSLLLICTAFWLLFGREH